MTNSGSVITRFSNDLQVVDRELPSSFVGASNAFSHGIGHIILVMVGSKFAAAAMPAVLLLVGMAQIIYLRTSTQLRVMDLEAKGPLMTHFHDVIRVSASETGIPFSYSVHNDISYITRVL